MSRTSNLPIVAIVGRPNVGKSTLFNRFAGARRALVEDVPGITRDRIATEIEVGARRVLIVDTAGLDGEAEEGLHGAVQQQARSAISEADAAGVWAGACLLLYENRVEEALPVFVQAHDALADISQITNHFVMTGLAVASAQILVGDPTAALVTAETHDWSSSVWIC